MKTGKTVSRGSSAQLCIIPRPASTSSFWPSWANAPKQGFLCTFLPLLHPAPAMSSLSFLLRFQKFSCSVPPIPCSSPLVFRVTTPCLGNYAAGEKHQLAASIISIIDHWNCPLILNSGSHSVFTCPVNQSYFFSECVYCVTVVCIFILLFYKQTFGFLTFFAKSMNF